MATDRLVGAVPRTRPTLEVVVTSALEPHQEEWDHLVDRQPLPTHYLRSWWLLSGVRGEPLFVLVKEKDDLRGGLALERDQWHGVSRMRTMATDLWPAHYDLIAEPGYEEAVCHALEAWFRSLRSCVLDLRGVGEGSRLRKVIPGALRMKPAPAAYCASLSGGLEGYLPTVSSNLRREIRRSIRRIVETGHQMRVVPPDAANRSLEALRSLQWEQFGSHSVLLPVFDRFAQAVRTAISRHDAMLLELCDPKGDVLGVDVWLMAGRRAEGFAHGLAKSAPPGSGNALIAFGIENAPPHIVELDMGAYHGEWKKRWASVERRSFDIRSTMGLRARGVQALVNGVVAVRRRRRQKR